MAYLYFQIHSGLESVTLYEELPELTDADSVKNYIEYNFDPSVDFISALTLAEDGTVVNKFPGKTVEEQERLFHEEVEQRSLVNEKKRIVSRIKSYVTDLIEPLENKEKKALEIDAANGNNDEMRKIAIYRQSVRDKNNEQEALLNALTTREDIESFNPNWAKSFPAFE